jgi:hypothetical protein
MQHVKLKTLNLKSHPTINERWIQDVIADNPSILGIGDLVLKDKERIHPKAGRLDLLLQEADGLGRYEVELQLGAVDESHIIRCIEYWDIERRRYTQYDHTAVIVAEDITSRFLNVISLLNGTIPLMAIQMTAIETSDGVGLNFTTVLDTVKPGLVDEDEECTEVADRSYWERRGTPQTTALADRILELGREYLPADARLSYNKYYIGVWIDNRACNYIILRPQKSAVKVEFKLPKTEEFDEMIAQSDLDLLDYHTKWQCYRIRVAQADLASPTLARLMRAAFDHRNN